ncbi:MAG TPA: cupin domain-containing protein [Bryobacteraceae bacterium]|nr:cupin domain-containing protein [Bryobacteraceae bacterium]
MNNSTYTHIADLIKEVEIPVNGILSRTLYNDDRLKVVIFGFAAGQELTAHTAPMPAVIQILSGEARLKLGDDTIEAGPGTFVRMPPQLEHGVYATSPVVMLLLMMKNA